ncbi:carbohydrate porin [Novosphingobium sediminicola]|uniref:High affinity Mn2+ porin n=1 Tax=Novosphingobium sediminicola TaxID=563162 RepID=A0A7W6CJ82_9SPHN|nr:carbohydrate porin [Novosphingobium sediminicola]MBB3957558.1 high affinity Mn2+ porin [Novosphingobium sediminicola]
MTILTAMRALCAAPFALGMLVAPAFADDAAPQDQRFAIHGQYTGVVQGVGGFASPYAADNSLDPHQVKATNDATLYLGLRLWKGGEIWINPEVDQGFGLSNTLGAGGFPSAEAYKVGKMAPYFKLQRAFVRQTIALGGDAVRLEAGINQLRATTTANRLVITAGKMGVGDIFDTNKFAHDPRGDFLNWALVDTGSFDYAANAWGYTYGIAAEWYQGPWTLRAGLYNLSKVPNGVELEADFSQNALMIEGERRFRIAGREGALRVTGFRNRGLFARFDEALAKGVPLDLTPARRRQDRFGIALNAEQDVTDALGLFLRAGTSDGAIETYDFTDIDRSLAFGGALKGKAWGRPQDTLAVAGVVSDISDAHKRWLAAGGMGVLVGDGALPHPGDERIIEVYYAFRPVGWGALTVDYQHIANPGYNRDRGPADIVALRVHAGF